MRPEGVAGGDGINYPHKMGSVCSRGSVGNGKGGLTPVLKHVSLVGPPSPCPFSQGLVSRELPSRVSPAALGVLQAA